MITEPAQRTARPNVRTAQHYRGGTESPAQLKADQPRAAQGTNGSDLGVANVPSAVPLGMQSAPWHVRNSRWVLSAALLAAVLGLAYTSFHLWRTFRPNPLDLAVSRARQSSDTNRAVEAPIRAVEAQISPTPRAEQTAPAPAGVDGALPADEPATPGLALGPSQRAITHTSRIDPASIVATPRVPGLPVSPSQLPVTHTKRVDAAPTAQPRGVYQDPGRGPCTEAVAALGLCNPGARGGSN